MIPMISKGIVLKKNQTCRKAGTESYGFPAL